MTSAIDGSTDETPKSETGLVSNGHRFQSSTTKKSDDESGHPHTDSDLYMMQSIHGYKIGGKVESFDLDDYKTCKNVDDENIRREKNNFDYIQDNVSLSTDDVPLNKGLTEKSMLMSLSTQNIKICDDTRKFENGQYNAENIISNSWERVCNAFAEFDRKYEHDECDKKNDSVDDESTRSFSTVKKRKFSKSSPQNIDILEAIRMTFCVLTEELNGVISIGVEALQNSDTVKHELSNVREQLTRKTEELQILRKAEFESHKTISKLLQSLEHSRQSALSSTNKTHNEIQLRSRLSELREALSRSNNDNRAMQHQISTLRQENHLLKSKLKRIVQERQKVERDSRATLSLARSMDNQMVNDASFYKQKARDLTEKMREQQFLIEEMKKDL